MLVIIYFPSISYFSSQLVTVLMVTLATLLGAMCCLSPLMGLITSYIGLTPNAHINHTLGQL
jgi:hypothetical protein